MTVLVAGLLFAACRGGSDTSAAPARVPTVGTGSIGSLRISGAYIPAQSTPQEAAAYFTIRNTGTAADVLLGASSPLAASVTAHDETSSSVGMESMTSVGTVNIPGHATVRFSVGHQHLMLMNPAHQLRQGEKVPLTLQFQHAGLVTLTVPVTSVGGPADG